MIRAILFTGIMLGTVLTLLAQSQAQSASPDGKKEIPRITFKNLSPPYKDYDYFQDSRKYAFQFSATSFNTINAWWLAEASTLVYADEDFVRSRFEEACLPELKFFENQSTQCYVANNDKFAIVAFRGSEIWKNREDFDLNAVVADLKTNIDIRLINWEPGGKVHRGFKKALDEVWLDLLPHIRKLHGKGCKIWTTGHSLGAALATLFADRYGNVQGVYTFGSPRVGNGDFRDQINVRIYRIVNNNDIVPRVPPRGAYVHVGKLKFIDRDGIIQDTLIGNEPAVNQPRDETYGQEFADQPHNNSFGGFIPAPFRDHVPLLYAIYLWNNIIEGQR
jgi:triacylglycerol lipase